jgi:hypothetical protein
MTDIDTTKRAADMTPSEREAFIRQCKKLEGASSSQSKPVETTKHARDLSESERAEWLQAHRRKFQ